MAVVAVGAVGDVEEARLAAGVDVTAHFVQVVVEAADAVAGLLVGVGDDAGEEGAARLVPAIGTQVGVLPSSVKWIMVEPSPEAVMARSGTPLRAPTAGSTRFW